MCDCLVQRWFWGAAVEWAAAWWAAVRAGRNKACDRRRAYRGGRRKNLPKRRRVRDPLRTPDNALQCTTRRLYPRPGLKKRK